MSRGKDICKRLKDVRREIARANDIEYITSECRFKGECTGTCPKCEAEVRYLEEQLSLRHRAGKAVAVAGIAASMFLCYAPTSQAAEVENAASRETQNNNSERNISNKLVPTTPAQGDSIEVSGRVLDAADTPHVNVGVYANDGSTSVATDSLGKFSIKVPRGSKISLRMVGFKDISFDIPEDATTNFTIDEPIVMPAYHTTGLIVMPTEPAVKTNQVLVAGNVTTEGEGVTSIYIDGKCITQTDSTGFYEFHYPRRSTTLVFKTPGHKDVKVKINRKISYNQIDVYQPKL
ncbi:MAG: carboxypeptidase-like regulatory domain-containing protein [Muribaculaceae bacterium]|nr:carboxypeptidase-like regulatory domain-containing protein [Muribaculaceae bacterium]